MKCRSITWGIRCGRHAAPGANLCSLHLRQEQRSETERVYREARQFVEAFPLDQIDDPVLRLRVLFRRSVLEGDADQAFEYFSELADLLHPVLAEPT